MACSHGDCPLCLEGVVTKTILPCCREEIHTECLKEIFREHFRQTSTYSGVTCILCRNVFMGQFVVDQIGDYHTVDNTVKRLENDVIHLEEDISGLEEDNNMLEALVNDLFTRLQKKSKKCQKLKIKNFVLKRELDEKNSLIIENEIDQELASIAAASEAACEPKRKRRRIIMDSDSE